MRNRANPYGYAVFVSSATSRIAPFLLVASHARELACAVSPTFGVQASAHEPLRFRRRWYLNDYLDVQGHVSDSSFSDALSHYLSEYGGRVIYDAISQYINPQE